MPKLKEKSIDYLNSARSLINDRKFTASVHCSYYSALQFIKYYLKTVCGLSYDQQDTKSEGSHVFLIETLLNHFNNPQRKRRVRQDCLFLKEQRKIADYTGEVFDDIKCLEAESLAKNIIQEIKNQFGVV